MSEIPTCIVGVRFRGQMARNVVWKMEEGSQVLLEREPDNPHDSNAVKCWFLGIHVGYIPRQANPRIAAALDADKQVTCVVTKAAEFAHGRRDPEPSVIVSWSDE